MKKLIIALLLMCLIVSLGGCGLMMENNHKGIVEEIPNENEDSELPESNDKSKNYKLYFYLDGKILDVFDLTTANKADLSEHIDLTKYDIIKVCYLSNELIDYTDNLIESDGRDVYVFLIKSVALPESYSIKTQENEGVNFQIASSAKAGDEVSLNYEVKPGYELLYLCVIAGNKEITVEDNKFIMPESDVIIFVECEEIVYEITIHDSEGGSIDVSPIANSGRTMQVIVTADEGYELESLQVITDSGVNINVVNNTFEMPYENLSIKATFTKAKYAITTQDKYDFITIASCASFGDKVTITLIDNNYIIHSVEVLAGDKFIEVDKLSFIMPAHEVIVIITFTRKQSTLNIDISENDVIVSTIQTTEFCGDTINKELSFGVLKNVDYIVMTSKHGQEIIEFEQIRANNSDKLSVLFSFVMPEEDCNIIVYKSSYSNFLKELGEYAIHSQEIQNKDLIGLSFNKGVESIAYNFARGESIINHERNKFAKLPNNFIEDLNIIENIAKFANDGDTIQWKYVTDKYEIVGKFDWNLTILKLTVNNYSNITQYVLSDKCGEVEVIFKNQNILYKSQYSYGQLYEYEYEFYLNDSYARFHKVPRNKVEGLSLNLQTNEKIINFTIKLEEDLYHFIHKEDGKIFYAETYNDEMELAGLLDLVRGYYSLTLKALDLIDSISYDGNVIEINGKTTIINDLVCEVSKKYFLRYLNDDDIEYLTTLDMNILKEIDILSNNKRIKNAISLFFQQIEYIKEESQEKSYRTRYAMIGFYQKIY